MLQKNSTSFISKKYEEFRESYFKNAAELAAFFNNNKISALLMSPDAPMSKKDWLEKEIKEAIESENYEYCTQLKIELNGL